MTLGQDVAGGVQPVAQCVGGDGGDVAPIKEDTDRSSALRIHLAKQAWARIVGVTAVGNEPLANPDVIIETVDNRPRADGLEIEYIG